MPSPVPETSNAASRAPDLGHLPAPDREMSGYGRMASVPLDPRVIRWIPAVALFVAFVLTLLPWNGLYPAGYPAFTQSPWHAVVASMSRDPVADDALRVGETKVGDILDKKLHMNWWLFPYIFLLFPTLLIAAAGPVVDLAKWKGRRGSSPSGNTARPSWRPDQLAAVVPPGPVGERVRPPAGGQRLDRVRLRRVQGGSKYARRNSSGGRCRWP